MIKVLSENDTLPVVDLVITSLGETFTTAIEYLARDDEMVTKMIADENNKDNAAVVEYLVSKWDLPYSLDTAGCKLLAKQRPSVIAGLIEGWYKLRYEGGLVKN